ncbi:hypothetical protein DQ04_04491020 [Trypanosoma grayi]|uniref:hypothetical protein n=1 Tax=Trypanosoma grayi TaxID=71804 RepID=UPI0004F442A5|nr:hypothetical protein DQ04_04491020 [Trypanosoma grayi]KEG09884.1 hypothetical protein DQ04_04491020 [Trypanosoma grayi]
MSVECSLAHGIGMSVEVDAEEYHPQQQQQQPTTVTDDAAAAVAPSLMVRFVHFLWACYNRIDAPLEALLQQSVELARFVESNQGQSFLPHHQQQVRWALWELLHDAAGRESSVVVMEKESRLYGGWSKTAVKRASPSVSCADHKGGLSALATYGNNNNSSSSDNKNSSSSSSSNHAAVVAGVPGKVWHAMSEAEEDALLAALRARGHYHMRIPRHAQSCPRRDGNKRTSHVSAPSFRSRLHDSLMMAVNGPTKVVETTTATTSEHYTEPQTRHNSTSVDGGAGAHGDPHAVIGTVESLTTGCSLCTAQGLIQGCWVSLRLLQLMDMVAATHLCATPLLVPHEALSTRPCEALCVGYHVAQHQLQLAIGLMLSIVAPPLSSSPVSSAAPGGHTADPMLDDEKEHHAKASAAIGALALHGLDVCVHLLAALRCLQPDNVYVVLLHAAVLSFCDQHGVSKARKLLRDFATTTVSNAAAAAAATKTDTDAALSSSKEFPDDCDAYDMWLLVESSLRTSSGMEVKDERTLLLLEQMVTGVLFTVFLQLVELKELPPPPTHCQRPSSHGEAAAACLRAREALDTIVRPRLLKLCDAADGAISTRGCQSESLYWLLRGTLCHILNALSMTPSTEVAHIFDAEETTACTREAVKRGEAAREFVGHPLAPQWVNALLSDSEAPKHTALGEWRLQIEKTVWSGNDTATVEGGLPGWERVTDVALLPPAAMRMWMVLTRTLFRSVSADLVVARARDDVEAATASAPPEREQTGGDSFSDTQNAKRKEKKGVAAQRAVMAERENAHKIAEVQCRTEQSSIGFWFRWRKAFVAYRLLSTVTDGRPSLLERYRQLLLAGGCKDTGVVTSFMLALQAICPIAPSQQEALAMAQLFPAAAVLQEGEQEFSLATLDGRLREAWQRYDLQCVQPAMAHSAGECVGSQTPAVVVEPRKTVEDGNRNGRIPTKVAVAGQNRRRSLQSQRQQQLPVGALNTSALPPRRRVVARLVPLATDSSPSQALGGPSSSAVQAIQRKLPS